MEFVRARDIVSSELVLTEVPRAVRRIASGRRQSEQAALFEGNSAVLSSVSLLELNRDLLTLAGRLAESYLRALDAIHVVSALSIADAIGCMVTYDDRQASAASKGGLAVAVPGR